MVALASAIGAVCRAASPPLPESLLACAKLQDPMERVHCYDAQIAALRSETNPAAAALPAAALPAPALPAAVPPPGPTVVVPAAAVSASPAAPASAATEQQSASPQFGDEQLPLKSRATPPKQDALLSSITEMRTIGQKIYLISLANGQVWRQEGSPLPALFRVGNDVRIERGALGSYHLSVVPLGEKNWVLVTRAR